MAGPSRTSKTATDATPDLADDDSMLSHGVALRAYFKRRVRNSADVDDYVQEVYARVLGATPSKKIGSWRGFLFRAASNLLVDHSRRDQTRMRSGHIALDDAPGLTDGQPSAERALAARQRLRAMAEALKAVDPVARSVFLLVRVEGLTHREAADRLGLDMKRASHLVEKVLTHLARAMAEEPEV